MSLLLDSLINNYLGIISCFTLLLIPYLNKYKFISLITIDILLNKIPIISFIILLLYFFNKLLFKILIKSNLTILLLSILNLFLFITIIYFIFNYNFSYIYYLKYNIFSICFNIIIFSIYIYCK